MRTSINVGGQAVIEGVMMRAPKNMTVAVRMPSGEIVIKKDRLSLLSDRYRFLKWPVLRGTVTLFSSLGLGIKALNFSAACSIEEPGKPDGAGTCDAQASAMRQSKEADGISTTDLVLWGTVAFSLVLGLGLFFYLPLWLTELSRSALPSVGESSLMFNLVDGVIRTVFFLLYVVGISLMPDIRRVFEYHGAEHKAIFAYEAGGEVTVEDAKGYPRIHPRCGTSFLLVVMLLSIVVFSFVPKDTSFYMKALSRLALIPLIAGLSYEFIRYTGKRMENRYIRMAAAPGMWLQRLTTREPSDDQIEVAVHALKEALAMEDENILTEAAPCLRS